MSLSAPVGYSLKEIWVAKWNSNNTFGTPAMFLNAQKMNVDPQQDEDEIKSYGNISNRGVWLTALEGTIDQVAIDFAARAIITGDTVSNSSAGGGAVKRMGIKGGGTGTPYVGVVAVYYVEDDNFFVLGVPKCKFMKPSFTGEQNKFITAELSFKSVRAGTSGYHGWSDLYELEAGLPDFSDAADWLTFFSEVF